MQIAAINITDHSKEFLEAMKSQVVIALSAIGQEAEGYAKDNCPVDTGRLRNSITNHVVADELAVYIGTNVEYAPYVEYRDVNHDPPEYGGGKAHFLRDAVSNHTDHYKEILEAFLKE